MADRDVALIKVFVDRKLQKRAWKVACFIYNNLDEDCLKALQFAILIANDFFKMLMHHKEDD